MEVGDVVKPKGHQAWSYRKLVEGAIIGIIVEKNEIDYGQWEIIRYTVLWDNKNIVEHAWMEIEKI